MAEFFTKKYDVLEMSDLFSLSLAAVIVLAGMGSFTSFSMQRSSSFLLRLATIWLNVPFLGFVRLNDFFERSALLAHKKLSIFCWA